MSALRLDPAAVVADLDELADQSGGRFAGADRLAWTPAWLGARRWLRGKLEAIGLTPRTDPAGNLWAAIAGEADEFLIVGSHIDAVPDGGWLDGALGLLTALEVMRQLQSRGGSLPIGVRSRRLGRRGGRPVQPQPGRLLSGRRDPGGRHDVRTLTDRQWDHAGRRTRGM